MKLSANILFVVVALSTATWPAPEPGTRIRQVLSTDKVSESEARAFEASTDSAARTFHAQRGKLATGEPMPAEVEAVFDQLAGICSKYSLRGDQTLDLLGSVLLEFNPRMVEMSGTFNHMSVTMREHNVPGPELYRFLVPTLKKGLRYRLAVDRSDKPRPSLATLREARAFAERYGLPFQDLMGDIQKLRAFSESLDPSP